MTYTYKEPLRGSLSPSTSMVNFPNDKTIVARIFLIVNHKYTHPCNISRAF